MCAFTPKISCTTTSAPIGCFAGVATYAPSSCPSSAFTSTQSPIASLLSFSRSDPSLAAPCARVRPHLRQPAQKSQQLPPLRPQKPPEVARANLLRVLAGERLQSPPEVIAAPGSQPVPPRRRPQKP